MLLPKPHPVDSTKNLRERLERLFKTPVKIPSKTHQLSFVSGFEIESAQSLKNPSRDMRSFLDFIAHAMPDGDVYLFGGVLRDMALLGRRGFNSDIDIVVEGNWAHLVTYLESLNANKNKFGGYRLMIDTVPVDIWHAEETWAIKKGIISYRGIASLTETTVLNWDAILMNWRTRAFICRKNYFEEINERVLDVVLEENPNPLGMAVRVFRHLCLKDARKISATAVKYLANCAKTYSYDQIKNAELASYQNSVIAPPFHRFFECIDANDEHDIRHQYSLASEILERELRFEQSEQR